MDSYKSSTRTLRKLPGFLLPRVLVGHRTDNSPPPQNRNLHFTVQLSTKIFHPDGRIVWSSKPVTNYGFDEGNYSFYADDMAITMSEDGNSYSIKSMVDPGLSIDLTCTRLGPGFKIGKDGKSLYGTDPEEPWGAIRHIFWPRNKLTGFMVVAEKGEPVKIDFSGTTMLVMALQAMKPHHAGMSISDIWGGGIIWSLF